MDRAMLPACTRPDMTTRTETARNELAEAIGRIAKGDRKALKEEQPSNEQIAFASLMRGVHW